ncbi:MAG TPA: pyrrolo-quinoline quinone [Candidatus Angelobacter sp.]|nr:pyrrolo-quinoline quinone [Candidatus Angelobacter sp.]
MKTLVSAAQKLRTKFLIVNLVASFLLIGQTTLIAQTGVNVFTYHNDLARTGQNLNEKILTPANVNPDSFGLLFTQPVDGYVYAQPLYMSGVPIPGKGTHNVVFVATEHDSVYAFDADNSQGDNAAPLWRVSFINPAAGVTTVPMSEFGFTYPPELGVTGTPVIDPSTGTLFVVAKIEDNSSGARKYAERLFALDVATGTNKFGGPVDIQASVHGTGAGSDAQGNISFDPYWEFQRTGLTLAGGVVYVAFASQGDEGPYHGWIVGYDAHTLQRARAFNDTPNGSEGGIWMSGAAPAGDADGNIYCMTGNGTFDANSGGPDYGDSFLRLLPSGNTLVVTDFFTPYDQAQLDSNDGDLGSGAPMILPDVAGSVTHPHLLVGCGKEGVIYLLDRDNMGRYNPNNNDQIVQSFGPVSGTWSMPAYFNNLVYIGGVNDHLKAYRITNGLLTPQPDSQTSTTYGYPGVTPSISADGTNNAIVWAIETDAFFTSRGPAVLRAHNATNLAEQFYSSSDAGARDQLGLAQHFGVPTISNGRVYVATAFGLSAFGLLAPPQPRLSISPDLTITVEGEVGQSYSIEYTTDLDEGWSVVETVTLTNSPQSFTDFQQSHDPQGFFRVTSAPL